MSMIFDDENVILDYMRSIIECERGAILQFNGNSFNKKIFRCLIDKENLVANNGHGSLPPDYYSDRHSMMFDVLRINDSEIKKSYNPVKMRERDNQKEILNSLGDAVWSDMPIFISSESDDVTEHTYKNYVKNAKRVIGEHIKKISIWKKEHPNIKHKGLLVFDETEVYYEGFSGPTGRIEPGRSWLYAIRADRELHRPWLDARFVQQIYESELDFVVWFCPYKINGVARQIGQKFEGLVIVDVRFYFDKYVNYPDTLVC